MTQATGSAPPPAPGAPSPATAPSCPASPPEVVVEDRPSAVEAAKTRVATRFSALVASHTVIDVFPILFSALLWPLQSRLGLESWQVTAVIMATPIFSGALQPLAAYLTDKHDTRLFGPVGLAIGALCIGSIGLAQNFWQLIALQIVGVIGAGMYHPISTALAGQTGARLLRNGRAQAIGIFICAGMLGHAIGAELGPVMNTRFGMASLMWLIPPALVVAVLLHVMLRHVRHRHDNHHEMHAMFSAEERRVRWRTIAILAGQNAMRFIVNVGLLAVMFNVWAKSRVLAHKGIDGAALSSEQIASASSLQVGHLSVALTFGMGAGVLLTGRLVKRGAERGPLIYLSVIGALFTIILGHVGNAVESGPGFGSWAMLLLYACVAMTAMGFFATFPIATSLAQRLQPGHTSFVTSLMMGTGWAMAALCVPLAYLFFGLVPVDHAPGLEPWRINIGFYGFGVLLLLAGVSTLLIPKELFARAAEAH